MNKEQILNAITRIASTNEGVPPGKQQFFKETGVKESSWSGKYWLKWGDALIEAGYLPNQMQKAFTDEVLLERYAHLMKEIGRIPTSADLRMKSRSDEAFPSHNTFARFGLKQHLLERLLIFCQQHHAYADLIKALESVPKSGVPLKEKDVSAKAEEGHVYLLMFGAEYKIGSSNNVERRFREIKTQMPYDGKIIHAIATSDPSGIETYWHQFFKDKRLKGEWFNLSTNDVAYFKKRKLM